MWGSSSMSQLCGVVSIDPYSGSDLDPDQDPDPDPGRGPVAVPVSVPVAAFVCAFHEHSCVEDAKIAFKNNNNAVWIGHRDVGTCLLGYVDNDNGNVHIPQWGSHTKAHSSMHSPHNFIL